MSKILVTGATGFVGRHLCTILTKLGHEVIGTSRATNVERSSNSHVIRAIGDIGDRVDWSALLEGVDSVIHLAARVHVMAETEEDPLQAFRRVNVQGTRELLEHPDMQRVRRFIYISTAKVHGEETGSVPFSISDKPDPRDPYAVSKLEAENVVTEAGRALELETVIIRPPLIYGPGVGGNFIRLMKLVDKGVPLPFASIRNARSLVSVQNFCDLIRECLFNSAADGKRFLVSDGVDLSTPDLVRRIADAMSKPARLIPVPVGLLSGVASLIGRSAEISRLTGSLQINIDDCKNALGWTPPLTLDAAVQSTVDWFKKDWADA